MKCNEQRLINTEYYCLCLIAFSLPILEIGKHFFSLAYLLTFSIRFIQYRHNFTFSPTGKYILIFLACSTIAAIGSGYNGFDNNKLHDIFRYGLIGWMVLHTPLHRKQIYTIIGILTVSTLIGIAEAHFLGSSGNNFKLRSVGHINHSAIYLLLIFGAALPFIFSHLGKKHSLLAVLLINAIFVYTLLDTNSRATAIGAVVLSLAFLIVAVVHYRKLAYVALAGIVIVATYFIYSPPKVIYKFIGLSNYYSEKLTPRERIWNTAYYTWKAHPIFGIGYGNYKTTNPEKMHEWHPDSQKTFTDTNQFLFVAHSHNRYLNTLAEGGIIGFIGLSILLFGYARRLLISYPKAELNKNRTVIWLIGLNTLASTAIVGLFNTTLHHEHGVLTVLLLGLALQFLERKQSNNTSPE